MASFPKSVLVFLLLTLLFSLQTLASFNVDAKQEKQPAFLPPTTDNAPYGLYGRQDDVQFPSSTTTTKKYNQEQHQSLKEHHAYYNNNKNKVFKNVENFESKEESVPAAATTSAENDGDYSGSNHNDGDYSGSNHNDGDYIGSNENDRYYGGSTESFNNYDKYTPPSIPVAEAGEFNFDP